MSGKAIVPWAPTAGTTVGGGARGAPGGPGVIGNGSFAAVAIGLLLIAGVALGHVLLVLMLVGGAIVATGVGIAVITHRCRPGSVPALPLVEDTDPLPYTVMDSPLPPAASSPVTVTVEVLPEPKALPSVASDEQPVTVVMDGGVAGTSEEPEQIGQVA